MPKYNKVDLNTICNGAAAEVFQRSLQEVMENINDVNTDPGKARKIALTFTIRPTEDRSTAEISFTCQAKTQPVRTVKGSILMAREAGELVAYASAVKQEPLFKDEKEEKSEAAKA